MKRSVFLIVLGLCLTSCVNDTTSDANCPPGSHEDANKVCVPDDATSCAGQNCTTLEGYKEGSCEEGQCKITACVDGYILNTDGICEKSSEPIDSDTETSCGAEKTDCTAMDGYQEGSCEEGQCKVTQCIEGKHPDTNQTACENDTVEACGSSDNNCTNLNGWKSGDCNSGTCRATECLENYHVFADTCEADSIEACGTERKDCTKIDGVDEVLCKNGQCEITSCDTTNYYLNEGICNLNNDQNCGEAGKACEGNVAFCSNGECKTSCLETQEICENADGTKKCSDLSETYHCGACNRACVADASKNEEVVSCENKQCVLKKCAPGYTISESSTPSCYQSSFIFTVHIPQADTTVNFVENNDNDKLTFDCGNSATATKTGCNFNVADTHEIYITGSIQNIKMCSNLPQGVITTQIIGWGSGQWGSLEGMFKGCKDIRITATDVPDFTQVTSAKEMFAESDNVTVPTDMWDNTNSISFESMFNKAKNISTNIAQWNTSHVTSMKLMFESAQFGLDWMQASIGAWDVQNVKDMSFMFRNSNFFQDISQWNTQNVTTMASMFSNTSFNQDISGWNTSNVTAMDYMFKNNPIFNQPLTSWDTSNVTSMIEMFMNASSFNQPLAWNTSKLLIAHDMLKGATAFNSELTGWDLRKHVNPSRIFTGVKCSLLKNITYKDGITGESYGCKP